VIGCGVTRHSMEGKHKEASWCERLLIIIPSIMCFLLTCTFRADSFRSEGEELPSRWFPAVSFLAGICSGLFGIGGGLIFSPFLLHMGVDPAVGVVTSATAVIFTASSTTFQYLLMGRIIVPLALFYGAISTAASVAGAKLVTTINEKYGRGSILILVVGIAVGVSTVLSIMKGITILRHTEPCAPPAPVVPGGSLPHTARLSDVHSGLSPASVTAGEWCLSGDCTGPQYSMNILNALGMMFNAGAEPTSIGAIHN